MTCGPVTHPHYLLDILAIHDGEAAMVAPCSKSPTDSPKSPSAMKRQASQCTSRDGAEQKFAKQISVATSHGSHPKLRLADSVMFDELENGTETPIKGGCSVVGGSAAMGGLSLALLLVGSRRREE